MILSIAIVTFILTIWFKTDAFVEYLWFLPCNRVYKIWQDKNPDLEFTEFLTMRYNNFFTRLISCQYCIGFWLSLGISLYTHPINAPIIYVASLVLYKLV